jgi:hypothetical protein
MDHMNPKTPKALVREMTEVRPGRTSPSNLRDQVYWGKTYEEVKLNLSAQQNLEVRSQEIDRRPMLQETWPTPSVRDGKGGFIGGRIRNGKYSWDALNIAVQYTDNQSKTLGHLNPDWVEWLMNFPIGWTSIEPLAVNGGLPSLLSTDCPSEPKIEQDDCEGSETHRCQLLRQQHLNSSSSDTSPDWVPVVFSSDCDEDGNCPCGADYAEECVLPGPTQDGFEYQEINGQMFARKDGTDES